MSSPPHLYRLPQIPYDPIAARERVFDLLQERFHAEAAATETEDQAAAAVEFLRQPRLHVWSSVTHVDGCRFVQCACGHVAEVEGEGMPECPYGEIDADCLGLIDNAITQRGEAMRRKHAVYQADRDHLARLLGTV